MKGTTLGGFEELVLLAVEALGDNAYGVAVQELAEENAGRPISLGAVYAALHAAGWLKPPRRGAVHPG